MYVLKLIFNYIYKIEDIHMAREHCVNVHLTYVYVILYIYICYLYLITNQLWKIKRIFISSTPHLNSATIFKEIRYVGLSSDRYPLNTQRFIAKPKTTLCEHQKSEWIFNRFLNLWIFDSWIFYYLSVKVGRNKVSVPCCYTELMELTVES